MAEREKGVVEKERVTVSRGRSVAVEVKLMECAFVKVISDIT